MTPLSCSLAGQSRRIAVVSGSRAAACYAADRAVEDFFCNYGLNPAYRPAIEQAGLLVTGLDDEGEAVIVELNDHPFFIATLFCFQTRSSAGQPHPLTAALVAAARRRAS